MALADNLKKVSKQLIDKFGNTITLKVTTNGTGFDTSTMKPTGATTTTTATKGFLEDTYAGMKCTFYLDADAQEYDTITIKGTDLSILSMIAVEAQDTTIIYEAMVSDDSRVKADGR